MPGKRGKKPFRGRGRDQRGRQSRRSPSPPPIHESRESSRPSRISEWERAIERGVEKAMRQHYSKSPISHHSKRNRTRSRTPPSTYSRSSHHSKYRSPDRKRSLTPTSSRSTRRSRSRTPTRDYRPPQKTRRQSRSPPRSYQSRPQEPAKYQPWYGEPRTSTSTLPTGASGVNLVPVRGSTYNKSKPILVDLEPDSQPSVARKAPKKSKKFPKRPSAAVRKEPVYTSPELPNFIPEIKVPKALPVRVNDPEVWRMTYYTPDEGKDRIEVNAAHMSLTPGKAFLKDVHENGFVTLYIDKNNMDTLTMCSPYGNVEIFKAVGHGITFPREIEELLFRSSDVKKLTLFKAEIDAFIVANAMEPIDVIETHPIIKKNLVEIKSKVLNSLRIGLGETCEFKEADLNKDEHVRTHAIHARTLTYGIWLVASRIAGKAALDKTANVSGYMRYAIFSETPDHLIKLIDDPYYVNFQDNDLSSRHRQDVDSAWLKYKTVYDKTMKKHRPRFHQPFAPLPTEVTKNCTSCGVFVKPGTKHACCIKNPECKYPACRDTFKHTPITCRHIRAWCTVCQRRGHLAECHLDLQLPPPYLWACYLHYQRLNLDTSYMLFNRKYLNPFFHMFTLYGLPTSKLLKVRLETGIEADNPTARRFRQQESISLMPPPPPVSGKGKSLQTRPRFNVNRTTVLTQQARHKTTSSTTSTSTFEGPVVVPPLTLAMLNEGINLAMRISQGLEAGSSGTSHGTSVILPALLGMVKHLQCTGTIPTVPENILASQKPPTAVVLPSVDTTKRMTEQVTNLARSLAENVVVESGNNDPSDYVPTDDEDMAVNNDYDFDDDGNIMSSGQVLDRINDLLDSDQDDQDDDGMDVSDPTGTAAIGQSRTYYYADQNVMDDPIRVADLPPVLPAVVVVQEQPDVETSSQTQQQNETSSQNQQESETSSQNPTN